MIDLKLVQKQPEVLAKALADRQSPLKVDEFLELSVSYLSDRGLNGEAGRQQGYRSAYAEDRHEHACFVSEDVTGGHFVCEIQTVP